MSASPMKLYREFECAAQALENLLRALPDSDAVRPVTSAEKRKVGQVGSAYTCAINEIFEAVGARDVWRREERHYEAGVLFEGDDLLLGMEELHRETAGRMKVRLESFFGASRAGAMLEQMAEIECLGGEKRLLTAEEEPWRV